ncbi:MAG: CPBP family intramembrane metalloprotease, partial [Elusimicrobia bacterium]|nr:CPBP family intramembrane metalloprotease [Elusimicrobiota bacterium]
AYAADEAMALAALKEREKEFSDLCALGSLVPGSRQALIQARDQIAGRIEELRIQNEGKTLSPLKNVRWEGGNQSDDSLVAGETKRPELPPSGLMKAGTTPGLDRKESSQAGVPSPIGNEGSEVIATDDRFYGYGAEGLFERQADGQWTRLLSKEETADIENKTGSKIPDLLRSGKFTIKIEDEGAISKKKVMAAVIVVGLGLLGAASWASWAYWAQLTAVVPPIAVAGFVGYAVYRHFRPKAKPQENPGEPAKIIAVLAIGTNGTSQSTIVKAEPMQPEEAIALSALQKALARIARSGLPMPIEKAQLMSHRSDDGASNYQAAYDPATRTLSISARTLLSRREEIQKAYPEAKDRVSLEDVAIPVIFREMANAGFSDGSRVDPTRLVAHQFTEAPNYLIGDLAIQEARKVLQPVSRKEKIFHWVKRLAAPLLAAAVIIPLFPGLVYALGQFQADLAWQAGALLSAKFALYTTSITTIANLGLIYALRGTLASEVVAKDKGSKLEMAMYQKIEKMNSALLAPFLLLMAANEEQIFRWGLFGGLLWWFNLLPIGVVAAAIGAAIVSSYIFASPKVHPGSTRPEQLLARFALGNIFAYIYYATSSLIWPSLAHGLHNYMSFLASKYIFGPIEGRYQKRKGLAQLLSLKTSQPDAATTEPGQP